MHIKTIFLCAIVGVSSQYYEGDPCVTRRGEFGACIIITKCLSAAQDIRRRRPPAVCSYDGRTPIVCCEKNNKVNDCPPIPERYTANLTKTGQLAWDKCLEYMYDLFPCVEATEESDTKFIRENNCGLQYGIIGGLGANRNEFPHMAALGYGENLETVRWLCGGSLVSEYYVLTAAHCLYHSNFGRVRFVRLGAQFLNSTIEPRHIYSIDRMVQHPDFKAPSKYHDLALLRLNRKVRFEKSVRPACLNLEKNLEDKLMAASGWGATSWKGEGSDALLKVYLEEFTFEECKKTHPPSRTLRNGIMDEQQLCVGHHNDRKDTCSGDSGGPLQSKSRRVHCTDELIGITSFGRSCAVAGVPAVYTRVSGYVPWIESIVWTEN